MPTNHQTEDYIHRIRDALVFWAPQPAHPRLHGRVQIVDVFSLEVATGYSRDPHGRLLLHSAPSVAEGRSWSLAKAAQLIRNDSPAAPLGGVAARQARLGPVLGWWRPAALPGVVS